MKLVILVVPFVVGITLASAIWGLLDPGREARGVFAELRRWVGRALAVVALVAVGAAFLFMLPL